MAHPAAPGRFHIAFALLLVLALALGSLPVLRHTQKNFRTQRHLSRLTQSPLDRETRGLAAKLDTLELRAAELHRVLARAEDELLFLKNRREPALILKDVGDQEGRIGLAALEGAFGGVRARGREIREHLAQAQAAWERLRRERRAADYRAIAAGLDAAIRGAGAHRAQLQLYAGLLAEVGVRAKRLRRLAPQVADPVPGAFRELAPEMEHVRREIKGMGEAWQPLLRRAAEFSGGGG